MSSSSHTWQRFVRFRTEDGRVLAGEPVDKAIDVGQAVADGQEVQVNVLDVQSSLSEGKFTGETATISKLLSPIIPSEAGTIRCIGLNFKDHAAELNLSLPTIPETFFKPSTAIADPSSSILIPSKHPEGIDIEAELAVIIGRDCRNVEAADAADYILGYTAANDVTSRDLQGKMSQWVYCKGFDTFCPLGPCIVRPSLVGGDAANLSVKSILDGDVLQDGTTADFIFSVGQIVEHLSRDTTLPRGTVIITGTPAGIGHSKSPPRYLKPGADVAIRILPAIGTLRNMVALSS